MPGKTTQYIVLPNGLHEVWCVFSSTIDQNLGRSETKNQILISHMNSQNAILKDHQLQHEKIHMDMP